MKFKRNELVWMKAPDGNWHRGRVVSSYDAPRAFCEECGREFHVDENNLRPRIIGGDRAKKGSPVAEL
jgi:hypothetical protein